MEAQKLLFKHFFGISDETKGRNVSLVLIERRVDLNRPSVLALVAFEGVSGVDLVLDIIRFLSSLLLALLFLVE